MSYCLFLNHRPYTKYKIYGFIHEEHDVHGDEE